MTANQIAFSKAKEEVRTHMAQEAETHRANVARETEQSRANTLNYDANIYATQAGMHNAQLNADTQREIAGINAQTQRYAAGLNYAAALNSAAMSNEASHYKTDTDWALGRAAQHETARHNMAMEGVQASQASASKTQAASSVINTVGGVLKWVLPMLA